MQKEKTMCFFYILFSLYNHYHYDDIYTKTLSDRKRGEKFFSLFFIYKKETRVIMVFLLKENKTIAIYRVIQLNLLTSSRRESQSSLSFPLPLSLYIQSIVGERKKKDFF